MIRRENVPYVFGEPISGEFILACTTTLKGREVPFKTRLKALNQSTTYAGVLEGCPNHFVNQRIIKKSVEHARQLFGTHPPHLIAPIEKVIALNEEDSVTRIVVLPAVRCIAVFEANYPTKPDTGDYSALTVVWFQDDWALPIQGDIISALRSLPWANLAHDCSF
jgi:hypothetical protein